MVSTSNAEKVLALDKITGASHQEKSPSAANPVQTEHHSSTLISTHSL